MNPPEALQAGPVTPFILSLGSNLGDRRAHLENGLDFLSRYVQVDAVSRVVESPAWGQGPPQPDFLNLVLRGRTERNAFTLLAVAHAAESAARRIRTEPKGPRTLDVDLIFFGALQMRSARLWLPHRYWADRPFVCRLIPEIAGDLVDPETGAALRDLSWDDQPPGDMRVVDPIRPPDGAKAARSE